MGQRPGGSASTGSIDDRHSIHPLLKRVPPGVWVAALWSTLILVRTLQRPDELHRLLRYNGNLEDAPLLVTAVVTALGALLMFRAPLAAVAIALAGAVFSLGMPVRETPFVLFLQSSLVHVNTLLLQRVLAEPAWAKELSDEDRRGLTALF